MLPGFHAADSFKKNLEVSKLPGTTDCDKYTKNYRNKKILYEIKLKSHKTRRRCSRSLTYKNKKIRFGLKLVCLAEEPNDFFHFEAMN
jgi:hypothetical protein